MSFTRRVVVSARLVASCTRTLATSSRIRVSLPPPPVTRFPLSPGLRQFSTSLVRAHGHIMPPKPGEELHVTFIDKDGKKYTYEVSEGDNLLDIAQENDLEMEGACGGSAACSTCHVIVDDGAMYEKMPEPEDDENDMLDLAFGLTETFAHLA
ncbi:mitochondrial matrix iron-sulfur protein [Maublancomyces gigas]|uniref:Mitochondrial matrix iron-sulfur protein n=1 Tax=Discina gigas TaxID=1032678 RepID=A0ABR3GEN0_9PEZI